MEPEIAVLVESGNDTTLPVSTVLIQEITKLQHSPELVTDLTLLAVLRRAASDLAAIESVISHTKTIGTHLERRSRALMTMENDMKERFNEYGDTIGAKIEEKMNTYGDMLMVVKQNLEDVSRQNEKFVEDLGIDRQKRSLYIDSEMIRVSQRIDIMKDQLDSFMIETRQRLDIDTRQLKDEVRVLHEEISHLNASIRDIRQHGVDISVEEKPVPIRIADLPSDILADARRIIDERVIYGIGNPSIMDDPLLTWDGVVRQVFTSSILLPKIRLDMPFIEAAGIVKEQAKRGKVLRVPDLFQYLLDNNMGMEAMNNAMLVQILMDHYKWGQDFVWKMTSPRSRVSKVVKDIERTEALGKYRV
jgi:hypothetical protein